MPIFGNEMKKILIIAGLMLLAACQSTGPVQISKDTYLNSKQGAGGMFSSPAILRTELIKESSAFCMASGKVFQINSYNDVAPAPGRLASSEIYFNCLDPNDPEVKRVRAQRGADAVIETRQR